MIGLAAPTAQRALRLLNADARNVSRDPTMVFVIVLSVLAPIAFAVWRVPIDAFIQNGTGLADFTHYVSLLIITLPAFLVGWVTGFLFLEDRDDATLLAIDVSPMGKSGFFAYRIGVTAVLSFAIAWLAIALLYPGAGLARTLIGSAFITIEAACIAFLLPAIARNKVEGLALSKVTNIAAIPPMLVFINSPLRLAGGIVPTYWLGELFGRPQTSYLPLSVSVILATLLHLGALYLCYRFAIKRIG